MSDIKIILTETLRDDYRQLPDDIKKKFDKQLRFLWPKILAIPL